MANAIEHPDIQNVHMNEVLMELKNKGGFIGVTPQNKMFFSVYGKIWHYIDDVNISKHIIITPDTKLFHIDGKFIFTRCETIKRFKSQDDTEIKSDVNIDTDSKELHDMILCHDSRNIKRSRTSFVESKTLYCMITNDFKDWNYKRSDYYQCNADSNILDVNLTVIGESYNKLLLTKFKSLKHSSTESYINVNHADIEVNTYAESSPDSKLQLHDILTMDCFRDNFRRDFTYNDSFLSYYSDIHDNLYLVADSSQKSHLETVKLFGVKLKDFVKTNCYSSGLRHDIMPKLICYDDICFKLTRESINYTKDGKSWYTISINDNIFRIIDTYFGVKYVKRVHKTFFMFFKSLYIYSEDGITWECKYFNTDMNYYVNTNDHIYEASFRCCYVHPNVNCNSVNPMFNPYVEHYHAHVFEHNSEVMHSPESMFKPATEPYSTLDCKLELDCTPDGTTRVVATAPLNLQTMKSEFSLGIHNTRKLTNMQIQKVADITAEIKSVKAKISKLKHDCSVAKNNVETSAKTLEEVKRENEEKKKIRDAYALLKSVDIKAIRSPDAATHSLNLTQFITTIDPWIKSINSVNRFESDHERMHKSYVEEYERLKNEINTTVEYMTGLCNMLKYRITQKKKALEDMIQLTEDIEHDLNNENIRVTETTMPEKQTLA